MNVIERIEGIRRIAYEEAETKIYRQLCGLFERSSRDNLEDAKYILSQIPDRSKSFDLINFPIQQDNVELYEHMLSDYSQEPSAANLRLAIVYNSPKIIQLVCDKCPHLVTEETIMYAFNTRKILAIKVLRRVRPDFFTGMYELFKKLAADVGFDLGRNLATHEAIQYLLEQGLRPEYYNNSILDESGVIHGTPFKYECLAGNMIKITNTETYKSVTIQVETKFDDIDITIIEGKYEPFCNAIETVIYRHLERIDNTKRSPMSYVDLNNDVFARLREPPSLRDVAKNVMGVNKIKWGNLPLGLFE